METLVVSNKKNKEVQSYRIINSGVTIDVKEVFNHNRMEEGITINLSSSAFEEGNYTLSLKDGNLKILLTEIKEINSPIYVHHMSKSIFRHTTYERLHAFTIRLPKLHFYIARSKFYPDNNRVEIVLLPHFN